MLTRANVLSHFSALGKAEVPCIQHRCREAQGREHAFGVRELAVGLVTLRSCTLDNMSRIGQVFLE